MAADECASLPDRNNVYGIIRPRTGLKPVLRAVRQLVGERHAHIDVSGYNGAETLRFSTDQCDFESTPLDVGDEHLLNGGVAGSLDEIAKFVGSLSRCLSDAGIEHEFEIYDGRQELVNVIGN